MTAPMTRPTAAMLTAMRAAAQLGRGYQGEPWLVSRYWRVPGACVRRGWAEEYRVTPAGRTYYRLTDAGAALAVAS